MEQKNNLSCVQVYTADIYLFQKIRLSAPDGVDVTLGTSSAVNPIRLVDIDTARPLPDGEFISMSREKENADIAIPFSLDKLSKLLSEADAKTPPLTISDTERSVYLYGEKIKLTEVEYSLMSKLFCAGGEYVGRDELLRGIWGESAEAGVLNVYVHYLREKLEKSGEKIILSSRKCGYKISEKYIENKEMEDAQNS